MIDTHCHLTDARLFEQLPAVLARAASAGVDRLITIGTDLADDEKAVAVCQGRANIRCAIGIHPNYCHEAEISQIARLRELAANPAVVALGEMGLDYHHHFADKNRQRKFFEAQLQLAAETSLPVVIHCREAVADTLKAMQNFPGVAGVFHCFTGTLAESRSILEAGYLLGFTGVVTFKKSEEVREAAREAPADRILVETDAPYLSPEPLRSQKVNEPALVMHTATRVAAIRGISVEELDKLTTGNASAFFRWK